MERFFNSLRRTTESGKKQSINKESVSTEVKRTSWPLIFMESKTAMSVEPLYRLSNNEQHYWALDTSKPTTKLAVTTVHQGKRHSTCFSLRGTEDRARPVGSHFLYLKPIIVNSCNFENSVELLARKYERLIRHREELVFCGILELKESTTYGFPGITSGPQPYEYPEFVPKPLTVQNEGELKSDGRHSNPRQKVANELMHHDYKAAKLESWQRFYNRNAMMEIVHKEIDEYLSDVMFRRLLKETEVANTGQSTEYRTEMAVREYWESVRTRLDLAVDNRVNS